MSQHLDRQMPWSAASRVAARAFYLCMCATFSAAAGTDATSTNLPPGYSTSRTGDVHDFDYFAGAWITQQRRLKARGVGSADWEEFSATQCLTLYLGGLATVDELYIPAKNRAGLTLRTFDVEKRQWSIYWVNSAAGKLDPDPVVGGFQGNHGEFYAQDTYKGRAILVQYVWLNISPKSARMEQSFSPDGGKTWEVNWICELSR